MFVADPEDRGVPVARGDLGLVQDADRFPVLIGDAVEAWPESQHFIADAAYVPGDPTGGVDIADADDRAAEAVESVCVVMQYMDRWRFVPAGGEGLTFSFEAFQLCCRILHVTELTLL